MNIQLSNSFTCFDNENMVLYMDSISLPSSYYNVGSSQNKIHFRENTTDYVVYLPVGNYTARSLTTALQNLLNDAGGHSYTVTYSSLTNKFTISVDPTSISFTLRMDEDGPWFAFGLVQGQTQSSVTGVLQPPNVMTLSPYLSVFLHLDIASGTQSFDTLGRGFDVVERIPIVYTSSLLYYKPTQPNPCIIQDKSLSTFRVRLTTDGETPLNLNGLGWEVTFRLVTIPGLQREKFIKPRPEYPVVEPDIVP
jgi:hypothetical protein